jgi:general L-amino acid transport system permease protein
VTAQADQRLPPPTMTVGPIGWLRSNLFGSIPSSIATIIVGAVLIWLALLLAEWALTSARWGVVAANLRLFLIGIYPFDEAWRIWLSLVILSVLSGVSAAQYGRPSIMTLANWLAIGQLLLAGLTVVSDMPRVVPIALVASAVSVWVSLWLGRRVNIPGRWLAITWLVSIVVFFFLLRGLGGPLPIVEPSRWGGLLLTFVLAVSAIVLSFPFGVLLALGRRSDLPAMRWLSTAYIEIVRGVPLVTILFTAAIMLPLFLPGGLRVEHVFRAIAGLTLFTAAYVAENVRGGLQAIPSGQIEAAQAIGLNPIQTNLFIVLPQALRMVIPANVGLFISLLKDTTLVAIAGTGLLELLGIGRSVLAQADWLGTAIEVYIFISVVFFVMCYVMSRASYKLETELGVGKR